MNKLASLASRSDNRGAVAANDDMNQEANLKEQVIAAIRTVYDPEIPVNVYDLGLIYEVNLDEAQGKVDVKMSLTAPACPVAGTLPGIVENAVRNVDDVNEASVELVWDPPWTPERMSEDARLALGMM